MTIGAKVETLHHASSARGWRDFPVFPSEDDLATWVLAQLDPHFRAEREVAGHHCSGKRLRIDAILTPRDPGLWLDAMPVLGVEFKQPPGSTGGLMRWERQCEDYAHAEWAGYGHITVFACPPITQALGRDSGWGERAPGMMARWMGPAGVGDLGLSGQGLTFMLTGEPLWTEKKGLCQRRTLIPKTGSR